MSTLLKCIVPVFDGAYFSERQKETLIKYEHSLSG